MTRAPQPAARDRRAGPRYGNARSSSKRVAGLLASTLAALPGCSTASYLVHVSLGQMHYLLDRERLTDARIAALPGAEQRGLDVVRRAQAFGEHLGLTASTSYRHLIERDSESAVQVVTAAPPDRLEAITWWFPITGRISYRGYFDAARAQAFADELAAAGNDTYVRSALMYSTLGWFDDPIPRVVLSWPEPDLVDVALHEQVHETVFAAGDPDYNEALASFVARLATLEFLADDPERHEQARRVYADRSRFSALLDALYRELETLYASVDSPEEARERRKAVFERYQGPLFDEQEWESDRYAEFPRVPLSNSYLLARRTYDSSGPCFEAELRELGGDLRAFVAAHRASPGHRAELPACSESAP